MTLQEATLAVDSENTSHPSLEILTATTPSGSDDHPPSVEVRS
ncbi:hypothetical protein [Halostagnicola bangensis]